MEKVFVIIVTYNEEIYIEKCLTSIFASDYPVEVIVVDNNSADDTVKIIEEKFPKTILIKSKKNSGFGIANNLGMSYSLEHDSDYVFLLNADTWIESDTVEKLLKSLKCNKDYGILSPIHMNGKGDALDKNFGNYIRQSIDGCRLLLSKLVLGEKANCIVNVSLVNAAAWFISRDCLNTVGGFDPIFSPIYGEDDNYANRVSFFKINIGVDFSTKIYHDREERLEKKETTQQKTHRYYKCLLIKVVNINNSFLNAFFKNIILYCLFSFYNFLKMNFTVSIIYIVAIVKVLVNIFAIIKSRSINKKAGRNYLK